LPPLNTDADVARLKQLAELLDRQFSIGGIRFGIDSLIGLVPVVGDFITGVFGFYIISEARRLGVSKWTRTRMYTNWGIDVTVGALPIVGDIFDVAFKSNMKNLKLLIADLEKREVKQRKADRKTGLEATWKPWSSNSTK
jgi:Domain of unknown function (DUF4112)